jgi:hypothetical protein
VPPPLAHKHLAPRQAGGHDARQRPGQQQLHAPRGRMCALRRRGERSTRLASDRNEPACCRRRSRARRQQNATRAQERKPANSRQGRFVVSFVRTDAHHLHLCPAAAAPATPCRLTNSRACARRSQAACDGGALRSVVRLAKRSM